MSTPSDPSDRDPKAAADSVEDKAEGSPPLGSLADSSDDPAGKPIPRSDRGAARSREGDPLAAFLSESAVRPRQTPTQPEAAVDRRPLDPPSHSTATSGSSQAAPDDAWLTPDGGRATMAGAFSRLTDPPSGGAPGRPVTRSGQPDPPEPFVYLTDVVRVTSNPTSGSGSSNRAVTIAWLCVALVMIGVAFQFMDVGRTPREEPTNPEAAATSAGAPPRVPPAATPTVEAPRRDVAPAMPPAPKAAKETVPDVGARVDGGRSRPQPASGAPAPLTSKSAENIVGAGDPPPTPLPALPPPVAAALTAADLPKVDLPPPPRPPAPPQPAATAAPEVNHREAIQRVLDAYKDSYDRLDATSAALIWRGVDSRALARAFSGLSSQDLSFEQCDVSIDGAQATAVCRGELRYVRRVGTPTAHVLRASWTIDLERATDRWVIASVNVR